jgi:hypothetical protein
MRRALIGLALLAAAGCRVEEEDFDVHGESDAWGAPHAMKTIFLERHGATLTPGRDDSTIGRASVVSKAKRDEVKIPKYAGSEQTWKLFVHCLRQQYAPFDVSIVEERPKERGYILAVVGGTPSSVGFPKRTAGLAPYNGKPVEDAVVLIFSHTLEEQARPMCETAAMEIAHAYGLDHEHLCPDPMTYLEGCGAKRFRDEEAPCGEKKVRPCGDGRATQNSYRRLLEALGPRL